VNFRDKVVVITGASSGIGEASAIQFAKKGANVVLVGRRTEKLFELEKKLTKFNILTLICTCDVSNKVQVKEMSKQVLKKFGKIDILINNAGFAIYGNVFDLDIEQIESQMATNYFGMIYCTKNFLTKMIEQNSGHIINVASVAASFGLPGLASYCASKFAMLGFSEGLQHELRGTKVCITVVSPIMVRTNFFDHSSFESIPKFSPTSLSAETVAKAILRAANSSRLEIIVPAVVRGAVWIKQTFPYLINPIIGRSFKKYLESKEKSK
jgi:uncharacterized protein